MFFSLVVKEVELLQKITIFFTFYEDKIV